ncbi:membrane protein [Hoyosella rhizosphaerae]|uniref:Membrane protein n=1 Tax=Hoyosella rhizosphaerae TaxID=1755582 RepID=A0A916UH35_9ACTN|nr:membrane protein [Hoyosella rhizosphaerae]
MLGSWWQQVVRDLVGVERAERSFYVLILLLALVVALALVTLGRGIRSLKRRLTRFGSRFAPMPVARVGALVVTVFLIVLVVNGTINRGVLGAAERSGQAADQGTAEGIEQPWEPERSGSPSSLETWDTLGKQGRTFVAIGPTPEQIADVTGTDAPTPIRVYAGRDSAPTISGVADRVVAELERTGAFDRQMLAVVTTTGTGWVNNNVASAFEYVGGGDTAIAAMQYSFLPSPMAFLADRTTPQEAGRELFEAVYQAWSDRPEDARPQLYVFGESLGAYGGMAAFSSGQGLAARVDGALLVGPPNFAQPWKRITEERDPGSYERLPVIDGGRNIRFASDPADTDLPVTWEKGRILFWQHPTDPITWWSSDLLLSRPDWLREPLGPGVDPGMRWLPFVTFWQVTLDMVFATDVPSGYGHTYGSEAVSLWAEIIDPPSWSDEATERARHAMAGQ